MDNSEYENGLNYRLETPKLDKVAGYSLANKQALYADSHFVYAEILIGGEKALHNVTYTLTIEQKTLDHSTFSIECPAEAFEDFGDYPLKNTKYLLGKKITVFLKQRGSTTLTFTGIINNEQYKRDQNRASILCITGFSPTIYMERGKNSVSFENLSLEDIAKKLIQEGNYPSDKLEVDFRPKHKEVLPYSVQYQQSDWQFLSSLAQRYGELLFHDGTKLVFGGYGGKTVELVEEEDLESYKIKLQTAPQNFAYTAYQAVQGQTLKAENRQAGSMDIVNPFQHQAVKASQEMYAQTAETLYNLSLLESGERELGEEVKREAQARQNLTYLEGRSQNPNIRVGNIVKVKGYMPENTQFKDGKIPMESYLVTEIQHHYHEADGYYNTFLGIPKEQMIPPYYNARAYPQAEEQRAVVTDNNDPKGIGRIRVRFDWQKETDQSPWIRLVQPHGGSGKGFYFIPEIGEEVMVGFESQNMEKPYVLGTHYSGKEKSGYHTPNNDVKAIHTRSGHIVKFTEDESIIITDKSGNEIHLDTVGSNINITAPETMTLNAKNMVINVGENMTTSVGMNQSTSVGVINNLNVGGDNYVNVTGKFIENIQGDLISEAKQLRKEVSSKGIEIVGKEDVVKNAEKTIKNNSAEKSNLF